jgi:cytochrome c oxidase cbb3-type subunit I/II
MTFGMVYWLLPRIYQTKLYSIKLATTHFWLGTIGILLYIISIYVAGLTQGLMWRVIDETGRLSYPDFVETVTAIIPMWWVRVIGGAMYLTGVLIAMYNFIMTWRTRPSQYEEVVHEAAPLSAQYIDDPAPRTPLDDAPVADIGKKGARWMTFYWHRRWERLPVRFTVYTLIAVVAASLFEIIPTFVIRSNVPTIATVTPYTPLELAGRDIYIAEGCYNCHSQMIRPILAETERYGEYSKPGEFVYDHPFQWGSRRIGPDLARVGVTRPQAYWHYVHFNDPRDLAPQSVMPKYSWLIEDKLDFESIPVRLGAMMALGVPYTEQERAESVAHAQRQAEIIAASIQKDGGPAGVEDKKVVALIAYLQRMGTDIFKAPTEPAAPAAAAAK